MTGPRFRLGSQLPLFNDVDAGFRVTRFDGWWGVAQPRAELVPSGAGPGAVAVGPWDDSEAYYLLAGIISETDRAQLHTYRRQLTAALPGDTDVAVEVLDADDVDLQAFVRLYDRPTLDILGPSLVFEFPLVATDPHKYSLTPLTGVMGVFTGSDWFRVYSNPIPNTSYEADVTGWPNLTNCTVARSTAQAFEGGASMEMTASSAAAMTAKTATGTSGFAVVKHDSYTFSARFRAAATARSCRVVVEWFTGAGASISTSTGTSVTNTTTGWTEATVTAAAPATAAFGAVGVEVLAPANAEVHFVDKVVGPWGRVYAVDTVPTPDLFYRTYEQAQDASDFPPAVVLTSAGDTTSRRLTVSVTGPVTLGDWHLLNEATGARLWVDLSLLSSQTVVFDCLRQTAELNGADITNLVFGDFLTLEPGSNTYRLVSGTESAGFAQITDALAAYR